MISAVQVREALALLGCTPLNLAARAFLALDEAARAQDDIGIRHLGGLYLGAIREALEAVGVKFLDHGEPGVQMRKVVP